MLTIDVVRPAIADNAERLVNSANGQQQEGQAFSGTGWTSVWTHLKKNARFSGRLVSVWRGWVALHVIG